MTDEEYYQEAEATIERMQSLIFQPLEKELEELRRLIDECNRKIEENKCTDLYTGTSGKP